MTSTPAREPTRSTASSDRATRSTSAAWAPAGQNFYTKICSRYGYPDEALEIQDLYLAGKKEEAAAKVPRGMLAGCNLVGSKDDVAEKIAAFKEAGVTHLQVMPATPDPVATIEQLRDLIG